MLLLVAAKGERKGLEKGASLLFFKFLRFSRVGRCGNVQQASVPTLTTGVEMAVAVEMAVGVAAVVAALVSMVEVMVMVEIVALSVVIFADVLIAAVPVTVVLAVIFAACRTAIFCSSITLVMLVLSS